MNTYTEMYDNHNITFQKTRKRDKHRDNEYKDNMKGKVCYSKARRMKRDWSEE